MNRRVVGITLAAVVLVTAVGLAVMLDPASRVQGWVNGEPFYQGRSSTAWRRDLRNPDEVSATAATESLAAGKGESLPVCVWLLRNAPEPQVRSRAVNALHKMSKDAAPAGPDLVAALSDSDPLVRGGAVKVIDQLAPDVPGAVPALIALFPDWDAIRAVARFQEGAAEAVPKLTDLAKSGEIRIRRAAIRSLGKIGKPSLPALPDLIAFTTSDPESGVREQSAEAIGDIGPAAAEGIPALVKALHDPDRMVRRDAVRALGQMGPAAKGVLVEVEVLVNDPEEVVRTAATRAARLIDPTAK